MIKNGIYALGIFGILSGVYFLNQQNAASPKDTKRVARVSAPFIDSPVTAPETTTPAPSPDTTIEALKQQISDLQLANEALELQLTDVFNWILVNFQGRYPLNESSLTHLNLPLITDEFALHPDLAGFLNVTTDEQFLMEDALHFTRGHLRVLQDQHLSITSPTPAQVMMTFAEFPEEGQALRDDLYAALEASIGEDRLNRLLTVSEDQLDSAFDHFGQAARTLMFEVILDEADNQYKLVVNDGWFNTQNPDALVYTENETVLSSLPPQYADYRMYLPDTFAPFTQVQ